MIKIYSVVEQAIANAVTKMFKELKLDCEPSWKYDGLEPEGSYCAMYIIGLSAESRGTESQFTLGGDSDVQEVMQLAFKTVKVQFTFVGKNSNDNMSIFEHHIVKSVRYREMFQKEQLSPASKSEPVFMPQLRDTKWVHTSSIDVVFNTSIISTTEIDWVEYIKLGDVTISPYK